VLKLRREHALIAARRSNYAHHVSRGLIEAHEGVATEGLRLNGLMRTRLAKSFADGGLAELFRQLRYKAEWAGRDFRICRRSSAARAFARTAGPWARNCR